MNSFFIVIAIINIVVMVGAVAYDYYLTDKEVTK